MTVRTIIPPFAVPTVVGNYTAATNVSSVTEDVRVAPDATAANTTQIALFSCDDSTIIAGSITGTFSSAPGSSATWPNAGVGVHYLGTIAGGVPSSTTPNILTSTSFQPPGWGPYLIALRVLGTAAVNLEVNGLGSAAGGTSLTIATVAISDKATGGAIGTAATTVDVSSGFLVTQTTAGQTLSLPAPTATTAIRLAYVENVGSASFLMHAETVSPGTGALYGWNGTAWGPAGAGLAVTAGGNATGSNINLGTTDAFAVRVITSGSTRLTVTSGGLVGIGQTTPLAGVDIASALILEPVAVGDGTGSLGTAAVTVDTNSVLHVNQTTAVVLYANMRLIQPPTNTTGTGRKLTIVNVGTAAFIVGDAIQKQGINLIPGSVPGVNGASANKGQACTFEWNGTCWVPEDTGIGVGVVAAGLADGSAAIPRAGRYTIYRAAAWTQNGTLTASITGALIGDVIDVVRDDGSAANTMTVNNIAAAALVVAPASKKATIRITYQSTDWQLLGGGAF